LIRLPWSAYQYLLRMWSAKPLKNDTPHADLALNILLVLINHVPRNNNTQNPFRYALNTFIDDCKFLLFSLIFFCVIFMRFLWDLFQLGYNQEM
jgi:hypothetical protein